MELDEPIADEVHYESPDHFGDFPNDNIRP
jgi:hypothetical protein